MIPLYLEDGKAFVWNSDDWHRLRSNNRIIGALVGAIASYPRQNVFLGLPMALMVEEAAMLIENGVCELFSIDNLVKKPSEDKKKQHLEEQERLKEEQTDAMKKRKIEQMTQKIDIVVAGKRKKMQSKGLPVLDEEEFKQKLIEEEVKKMPALASAYLLEHLPTEYPWDAEKTKLSIDALRPSVREGDGELRYAVFKDLWSKGHYLTDGLKFGCDFLAYPGDPVRFHAMYMVRCVNDAKSVIKPTNIVAYGRLSVAVNKLAVLASFNSHKQIIYQTVQWHEGVNT